MSKRTLITAFTLSGLMLGGCEKDANNEARIEPPVLPQPETTRAQQQQQQPRERDETTELDVLPAVTIISIELECPAADVYFPTGSAELDASDKADLDSLAACLKGTKRKEQVQITATTDPRGSERYNEQLSRRRAEAVAQYLRQQGVKEDSFQIRARGEQGVVEGIPMLWPLQREATVEPQSRS